MRPERVIAIRTAKTVYKDGEYCIKVFNSIYQLSEILNEALNQSRAHEMGLPVPAIRDIDKVGGKWAIVSDYIKGTTLDRLMAQDRSQRDAYYDLFVNLHRKLHSSVNLEMQRLYDKAQVRIGQASIDPVARSYLLNSLYTMRDENSLCHGDFYLSNIIVNKDGQPYILDWSHATRGDPCADAARTYLLFWLNGDIDGAERYLGLFCKKSGADIINIKKWMPIVATAQSVKGNEKEREFLLSWVRDADQV